jgi:tetratricopeptide (TPR) repeat protein
MRMSVAGSASDYVRYGEEAATLAQECDEAALRAAVGTYPAFGHVFLGDGREMLKWSARVLDEVGTDNLLGKPFVGWSPRVSMLVVRARAFTCLGRLEEARSQFGEAARVAEESRELEILGWLVTLSANLPRLCGGGETGLERARRSLDIAEQSDNPSNRVTAFVALAEAYLAEGQPAAARDATREGVAIARDLGAAKQVIPYLLTLLAEAALTLGERTEAVAAAREGIDLACAGALNYYEAEAQLALAAALLPNGVVPRAEIESALARAEQLVESIAARSLSPRILELRGRLAAAYGDAPAADRTLRQALQLYREIGASGHAERLARELT